MMGNWVYLPKVSLIVFLSFLVLSSPSHAIAASKFETLIENSSYIILFFFAISFFALNHVSLAWGGLFIALVGLMVSRRDKEQNASLDIDKKLSTKDNKGNFMIKMRGTLPFFLIIGGVTFSAICILNDTEAYKNAEDSLRKEDNLPSFTDTRTNKEPITYGEAQRGLIDLDSKKQNDTSEIQGQNQP